MSDQKSKVPEIKMPVTLSLKTLNTRLENASKETDGRLDSLESSLSDMSTSVDNKIGDVLFAIKALSAKNNPVSISKDGRDSRDVYQHADENGIVFADGSLNDDVEVVKHRIMSVNDPEFVEKADQMRFDNESIQIMVMPSTSTYPDHTFSVGVNGIQRLIVRGQKQWIPRNYVEVLLRSKISSYGNYESRNQMTNEIEVKNPETKSHRYPVQIIKDPNLEHGPRWLERVSNDMRA